MTQPAQPTLKGLRTSISSCGVALKLLLLLWFVCRLSESDPNFRQGTHGRGVSTKSGRKLCSEPTAIGHREVGRYPELLAPLCHVNSCHGENRQACCLVRGFPAHLSLGESLTVRPPRSQRAQPMERRIPPAVAVLRSSMVI